MGRIVVQSHPRQKVYKLLSQPIRTWYGGAHLSSQPHGKHKWEDRSPDQHQHGSETLSEKSLKQKRTGVVPHAVKHLPNKHLALNSTPVPKKSH
jgi:hypothetical protein